MKSGGSLIIVAGGIFMAISADAYEPLAVDSLPATKSQSTAGQQQASATEPNDQEDGTQATDETGPADQAREESVDRITVTASPIRDAQQAALDDKRQADNYTDVVSADTIGRFPDQNIADSLSRLPGIAVERDQGQARFLNLRGAPFRWTSIAFDGIDVPGAENGRIPRFDSFPSTITSRITVNKAILPSMPGESVAGFVNIETFKPFDVEGASVALDVGRGEQDLGGGDVERNSIRASWSGNQFGVVGFYSDNKREQITDNREYDLGQDEDGDLIARTLDFRNYQVTREDRAWGGRLEYRGNGIVESVFLSSLFTEFEDDEDLTQYVFDIVDPQPGLQRDNTPVVAQRFLRFGEYDNSTFTNTLGADIEVGEWLIDARINYTETEFEFRIPIAISPAGNIASFDISSIEDPILELQIPLNQLDYQSPIGLDVGTKLDIEARKIKLDAARDVDLFSRDTTVQVGIQYDERESNGFAVALGFGPGPDFDLDQFDTGVSWDTDITNSINATYFDTRAVRDAWFSSGLLPQEQQVPPDQRVAIDEDISAAYGMATTRFGWGNVAWGARLEYTDYISSGLAGDEPITVDDEFFNILPSAHVNVDLSEDLKFRLSASTGVNRPTYNEWRAAAVVLPSERQVSGGNPFLDAEETYGGDLSLEWYYATASILSFGAFHREIDNVIYQDVTTIDGGQYFPPAAGQTWQFQGPLNGRNGHLSGVEINLMFSATEFVGGPLGGVGFSTNLTLLDSGFDALDGRELGLPGTSDVIYNASLFYERYGLSARINYQYRDEWISPIEDPEEFWDSMQRVDASVSYQLPFDLRGVQASVYTDINNITDETDIRFAGNGTINQRESFGRRYMIGLRLSY